MNIRYFQNVSVSSTNIDLKFPIVVKANSEYVIEVKLTQLNNKDSKVHAPRFPKPKDESWFLTFGVIKHKELLALKRFTFGKRKEVFQNFVYRIPNTIGNIFYFRVFSETFLVIFLKHGCYLNSVCFYRTYNCDSLPLI